MSDYLVSTNTSNMYALPIDSPELESFFLEYTGYDTVQAFLDDNPEYGVSSVTEMLEDETGAEVVDDLPDDHFVELETGEVRSYEDIADEVRSNIDDDTDVTVWGHTFLASEVLETLDPIAFRTIVLDEMDGKYGESWEEFHNYHN